MFRYVQFFERFNSECYPPIEEKIREQETELKTYKWDQTFLLISLKEERN